MPTEQCRWCKAAVGSVIHETTCRRCTSCGARTVHAEQDCKDVMNLREQLRWAYERTEQLRNLLARSHALLEMSDQPPKKLLGEIAFRLGWAETEMGATQSESDPR